MTGEAKPARKDPADVARALQQHDVDRDEVRSAASQTQRSTEGVRAGTFRVRPLQVDVDESGGH